MEIDLILDHGKWQKTLSDIFGMRWNKYSDLPNSCVANLIIFWEKKYLHNLIRTYTFINSEISPSKPDFHLYKWEKNPSYTALFRPTRLLISEKSATYTIKWSYTIIWQVRVFVFAFVSFQIICLFHAQLKKTLRHI